MQAARRRPAGEGDPYQYFWRNYAVRRDRPRPHFGRADTKHQEAHDRQTGGYVLTCYAWWCGGVDAGVVVVRV